MTRPVSLRPSALAPTPRSPEGDTRADRSRGPFAAAPATARVGGGFRDVLRSQLVQLSDGEHTMHTMLRGSMAGRTLGTAELLAMQAGVYRYGQEIELLSRLVDRASGAVKQTLQSQT